MKRPLLCIPAFGFMAAVAAYALEQTVTQHSAMPPAALGSTAPEIASREKMDRKAEKIRNRLGIPSPLDASQTADPLTGYDPMMELYESGLIVPATLEQVEAALKAAAATPDPEDDRAALILKHRGSYRFFVND